MALTVHNAKAGFISGRKGGTSHLKAHLSYVAREGALHFTHNATAQTFNRLFSFAYEKLNKRKDARIAFRMHIALPYLWYTLSQENTGYLETKANKLTKFIADTFNLRQEDIMLFFHKPEQGSTNFHVHVVAIPQTRDGKALDISPTMLKNFHKALDEFLAEQGFEVFRYRDFPELGLNRKQIKALSLPKGVYKREPELTTAATETRRAVRMYAEQELNKRSKQVYEFCNLLFSKEDTVWIMLRNSETKKVRHRITKVAKINDKLLAYLRYRNAQGFDVYITLNTFKSDSQNRIEQEIEPLQDKVWLDIDSEKLKRDGLQVLKQIMEELNLPRPTALTRTSETQYGGNYQAVWKFNQKVEFNRLKKVMQALEKRYGLDATHDGARVFRLPGFNNKKKEGKAGRDLCSLVGTGKIYDISLLENLELRLTTHAERAYALRKNEEEKKEEAQPKPQPQPQQKPQPQQLQTQPQPKPEAQPKPKPQTQAQPQQTKPETQQLQSPQPKPQPPQKTEPPQQAQQQQPRPQTKDPWQMFLAYRQTLMQELKKLTGQEADLYQPLIPETFNLKVSLRELETSVASELLRHMSVQKAENQLRQILAKYRPLPEDYVKGLMLEAYQRMLVNIAARYGIHMFLSTNRSYSEAEWALAKEIAREALARFNSVEEAFEKAHTLFKSVIQRHRPEKLERNPNYVSLTMRKAFEEVRMEFEKEEQTEEQKQEEQKPDYRRGPPRRR